MSENPPDNVVQLGVLRINRKPRRCTCRNRTFEVDPINREVTCASCREKIDPFDAIYELANNHERLNKQHQALMAQRQELTSYKPWLLEVKTFERQYRSHKMLPCCPHCLGAFYLYEIKSWTSTEYETRRRASKGDDE